MTYILSFAIFGSLYLFLAGSMGLDVADCSVYEDDDDAYELCYLADQAAQPERVSDYFHNLFLIAYPISTALMTIALYKFPITGERRRKLEILKKRSIEDIEMKGETKVTVDGDK